MSKREAFERLYAVRYSRAVDASERAKLTAYVLSALSNKKSGANVQQIYRSVAQSLGVGWLFVNSGYKYDRTNYLRLKSKFGAKL